MTRGKGAAVLTPKSLITLSPLGGEKGGFTGYGIMSVKIMYEPFETCPIQSRLISERGFSLFLLLFPASLSKNTWGWECLTVPREDKK